MSPVVSRSRRARILTKILKKVELVANIAIIAVACLLGTVLIKKYLITSKPTANTASALTSTSPTLSALTVDWMRSNQTLVLAVSAACHFCTESAPFYKSLVLNKGNTRLVAVLPQSVEEGAKYLERLGVSVDEIRQLPLDKIGVHGTPSLILVDAYGNVKNFWVGKLPADTEHVVLDSLKKER